MMPPQTSEPSVKLGISICRLSTQFHINTVLDLAKNCLFDLIFLDKNMLTSLVYFLSKGIAVDTVVSWWQEELLYHIPNLRTCFDYNEIISNTVIIKQSSLSVLPDWSEISLNDEGSRSDHLGLINNIQRFPTPKNKKMVKNSVFENGTLERL